MNIYKHIVILLICLSSFLIGETWKHSKLYISKELPINYQSVLTGLDVLELNHFDILQNKRVGLIINHTSINRFDRQLADLIRIRGKIKNPVIFTPEHGFKGIGSAGELINNQKSFNTFMSTYFKYSIFPGSYK